jgi:hypothetical protein
MEHCGRRKGVDEMSREVMQQALDALIHNYPTEYRQDAVTVLRAELAKPEPEPVAWINARGDYCEVSRPDTVYGSHTIPLYRKEEM